MPKTEQELAWEINFIKDIQEIDGWLSKELSKLLKDDLSKYETVLVADKISLGLRIRDKSRVFFDIRLLSGSEFYEKKFRWEILVEVNIYIYRNHVGRVIYFEIPVSNEEVYTKNDLIKARNMILVNILNSLGIK